MPASAVSICQRALHMMGAGTIISLEDNNEKARVMKVAYEPVRDAELRAHRWHFAIKRSPAGGIAADGNAPTSDYPYQYTLPGDCLRVIEGGSIRASVDLNDYRAGVPGLYAIEGRKILTFLPAPLHIRYLARISDVALFDPTFCEGLSAKLALKTCKRITESTATMQELRIEYKDAIREARQANAIERAPEGIADDSWIMGRLG